MKYFLIKGFKGKTGDVFRMEPSDDYILFVAFGLRDLENTLKGILPRGYRVVRKETLSKRLREWGSFELQSLFRVPMVAVKEVTFKPPVNKQLDYFNRSRDKTFNIKVTKPEYWNFDD